MLDVSSILTFNLTFGINFWTILLTIIYIALLWAGYRLIGDQVKLVKQEVWNNVDRLKCALYSIFFANGNIIIVAMMITFAAGTNYANTGLFIIPALAINLLFITIYPLADFLYMATSQEKLAPTPIQAVFEKIINLFHTPISYIVAVMLYLGVFIIPPLLIIHYTNIEFIFVWQSWQLVFPMVIVTYYGSKGYITGLTQNYSHIPRLGRSTFLIYDFSHRFSEEFLRDPMSRITTIIMAYLYPWTIYSLITTFQKIDPNAPQGFNTMSYGITVYIVLTMGIVGYFSRFWGRKIKFKTIDIAFAAALIAAIGVNVLTNFTLVNTGLLEKPYAEWGATAILTEANANAYKWALAAIIEELVLTIVISYYFFEKRHRFVNNTLFAEVQKGGENFDPIVPFNLARSPIEKQRQHAYTILKTLYARIPVKMGYDITEPLFKDTLLDAFCDYDEYASTIAIDIMEDLIHNHPRKVKPLVDECIYSSNFTKTERICQIIAKISNKTKIHEIIAEKELIFLLKHPDFLVKQYSIKIIQNVAEKQQKLDNSLKKEILSIINGPDSEIQAIGLQILAQFNEDVLPEVFEENGKSHLLFIQEIAQNASTNLSLLDFSKMSPQKLVEMLDHDIPEIRTKVVETLTILGKFKKNKIPIQKFEILLYDEDQNVRTAALNGIKAYLMEEKNKFSAKVHLDKFSSQDPHIQSTLVEFLALIYSGEENLLEMMVDLLYSEESSLKSQAESQIVQLAKKELHTILNILVSREETDSYIKKGAISSCLISLGKQNPQEVITFLVENLQGNENQRINAATSLSGLSKNYSSHISLKEIITCWTNDDTAKVKKELVKVIANIAHDSPDKLKPFMPMVLKQLDNPNSSVRLSIAKTLLELSENVPKLIPLTAVTKMVHDKDQYLRETGMKIIALIGKEFPDESVKILLTGLKDDEWIVKNAAADAISELGSKIEKDSLIDEIKKLIKDESKWVQKKSLEILLRVAEKNPKVIKLDEILSLVDTPDQEDIFYKNITKLFGIVAKLDFERSFPTIIEMLQHDQESIRTGMISGVLKLSASIDIQDLLPKLLYYLSDQTALILQQSISLILKKLVKYESNAIKTRVISLLKIRCEVSQDPVICEVLSELQQS